MAMDRAEPILRARVIETLSARYDSRVELDHFHVSVVRGFEAEGNDLRLYPRRFLATAPLISIAKFGFRVSWASVFHSPMHVGQVTVEGMTIDIPPKQERGNYIRAGRGSSSASCGSSNSGRPDPRPSAGHQNLRR